MNSNIYIPASRPLKNAIRSIWQTGGRTQFHTEHIIPKGIIEVIFNFSGGSPIHVRVGDKPYHLSNCFINGYNQVPLQLQLPEKLMLLGVQFQPISVKKILGSPAGEFSDMIVDLSLLDSDFHSLWQQLADQNDFDDRVNLLCGWMEKKLPDWRPQEQMFNHFVSGTDQHDATVIEIARSLCYSPRQLSRKMAEATGMNTEELLLYKKYLHALHLIHHTGLPLTKIAYQSHFSDQSHFIKSFKAYSGMTPGEYKSGKSKMPGHVYENVR